MINTFFFSVELMSISRQLSINPTFKRIYNTRRDMICDIACLAIGIAIGLFIAGLPILICRLRGKDGEGKSVDTSEKTEEVQTNSVLTQEEKINFIYDYLKIGNAIKELGRFTGIYAQFLDHISEEIEELKSGNIRGPEYFRRLRLVQFALSMALVYARVRGDTRKIPEIEKLWKYSIRLG
jgi:hypothetical protein